MLVGAGEMFPLGWLGCSFFTCFNAVSCRWATVLGTGVEERDWLLQNATSDGGRTVRGQLETPRHEVPLPVIL